MKFIQKKEDLFLVKEKIISINYEDIEFLKSHISNSNKGRVRINLHPNNEDLLHEMIIVISPHSYIRPHKHVNKSEAFHIIYGDVDIILFDDYGNITDLLALSTKESKKPFYYRMSEDNFHTLIVRSDLLVVHEITNGPFVENQTVYADFSPKEGDHLRIREWQKSLTKAVEVWFK